MNKFEDVLDEFRSVVLGRHKILDSILPPLVFVLANAFLGLEAAAIAALGVAISFTVYRLLKRQPFGYALGGIGGVLFAILLVWLSGRAEGYFLPQLITSSLTAVACFVSVILRRPLVAFTSYLTRRWPLEWYWQPQVRPAYREVTIIWALFFGLRAVAQFSLIQQGGTVTAGIVNVLLGWPALILLLIISYIYGLWRLRHLHGPSVEEFVNQVPPPWEGQKKGF
jgi:hypothetical protein